MSQFVVMLCLKPKGRGKPIPLAVTEAPDAISFVAHLARKDLRRRLGLLEVEGAGKPSTEGAPC